MCLGSSAISLFTVLSFMWSVKTHCVARVLLVLAGKKISCFYGKNRNYDSYKLAFTN